MSSCRLPQLTAAIELVSEISRQLNERKTEAVVEITSTFEELERALHQRKTALITDLENICSTKQKASYAFTHNHKTRCVGCTCIFARNGHFTNRQRNPTCRMSHIPVNMPTLMVSTSPPSPSPPSLALLCPFFPSSPTYLSAGPAGPALVSPPGEGTHPEQLQLYGAGAQPRERYRGGLAD